MNSALSDRDKSLLKALADPSTDATFAQLPPDELGPWLDRPEIQSAIAAAFELREIRLRFKLSAATDRAIDRMTAVFDANKDLADATQRSETRRAASAIFRLSSRLLGAAGAAPPPSPSWGGGRSVSAWRSHAMPFEVRRGETMRALSPTAPSTPPPTANGSHSSLHHTSSSSALSASSAVKSSPPEPPPLDTYTPQASIAGVIAAFKQLPTDAPRAAFKLIERAIAFPIRYQPIYQERFISHLAASPALTARNRPHRADPIKVEGNTATQRITYTLEDNTTAAAIFRAIRRDPAPNESAPPSWPIDSIHPADTS